MAVALLRRGYTVAVSLKFNIFAAALSHRLFIVFNDVFPSSLCPSDPHFSLLASSYSRKRTSHCYCWLLLFGVSLSLFLSGSMPPPRETQEEKLIRPYRHGFLDSPGARNGCARKRPFLSFYSVHGKMGNEDLQKSCIPVLLYFCVKRNVTLPCKVLAARRVAS